MGDNQLERFIYTQDVNGCLNLINSGFNVDTLNREGETALFRASWLGDAKFVKVLLEGKANPNITDKYGCTPLHAAARTGSNQCVTLLLSYGANVNKTEITNKQTPLHYAVMHAQDYYSNEVHDYESSICTLLKNKANIDAQDSKGQTCLHIASVQNKGPYFDLLRRKGADLNIKDNTGKIAVAPLNNESSSRCIIS